MFETHESVGRTLVDPKAYAQWTTIHETFTMLRRDNPVARIAADGFDPFWAVTKFADIQEVSLQSEIFRNNGDRAGLASRAGFAERASQPPSRSLVNLDSPQHMKLRRITAAWFTPARVKKLEEQLRPVAEAAVAGMIERGNECEFAEDVALMFPLRVILSILGVPFSDAPTLLQLTKKFFNTTKDDESAGGGGRSSVGTSTNNAALADFAQYFQDLTDDRRKRPRDDLASVIANGTIDGELIADEQAIGYYITIATAGHDTTSSTLSGTMWAFCDFPDQLKCVQERPDLLSNMVDEAVRWTSPVQHFMRTANQSFELRGRHIEPGDWLMLCYPSGNRDEDIFEEPFKFIAARPPNKHVGFGYGAHMCLGMHLAKLEMRLFYENLLPKIESVELNGNPTRAETYFVGGPNYLPIRFRTK